MKPVKVKLYDKAAVNAGKAVTASNMRLFSSGSMAPSGCLPVLRLSRIFASESERPEFFSYDYHKPVLNGRMLLAAAMLRFTEIAKAPDRKLSLSMTSQNPAGGGYIIFGPLLMQLSEDNCG